MDYEPTQADDNRLCVIWAEDRSIDSNEFREVCFRFYQRWHAWPVLTVKGVGK